MDPVDQLSRTLNIVFTVYSSVLHIILYITADYMPEPNSMDHPVSGTIFSGYRLLNKKAGEIFPGY